MYDLACRDQTLILHILLNCFPPISGTGSLTECGVHQIADHQIPGSLCFHLLITRLQVYTASHNLFIRALGIELRSSYLQSKHWVICPAVSFGFLHVQQISTIFILFKIYYFLSYIHPICSCVFFHLGTMYFSFIFCLWSSLHHHTFSSILTLYV